MVLSHSHTSHTTQYATSHMHVTLRCLFLASSHPVCPNILPLAHIFGSHVWVPSFHLTFVILWPFFSPLCTCPSPFSDFSMANQKRTLDKTCRRQSLKTLFIHNIYYSAGKQQQTKNPPVLERYPAPEARFHPPPPSKCC